MQSVKCKMRSERCKRRSVLVMARFFFCLTSDYEKAINELREEAQPWQKEKKALNIGAVQKVANK